MNSSRRNPVIQVSILLLVLFIWGLMSEAYYYEERQQQQQQQVPQITLKTVLNRIDRLKSSLSQLWCQTRHAAYTGGFCLSQENIFQGGNHVWDPYLCLGLENLFGYSSVVDLGAGLGHYGRCMLRKKEPVFTLRDKDKTTKFNKMFLSEMGGAINKSQIIFSWEGFDGAGNVEELSNGFVKEIDLTESSLWLGRKYDWVMSLEVGEHIPKQFEKDFISNLAHHGCQGIVLSWAYPGQGGHRHVNEQQQDYIKKQVTDMGLWNDLEAENKIRNITNIEYFEKTVMVFRYNKPRKCTKG